jgi:signal transduction histidine kinase
LEISRDVQALSHELHSSKLDFLGLVPAFASFCRELTQLNKIKVHFTHADIPLSVPRDISLCLFRILQEAAHNVVKHSGARSFDVELRGVANHVYLFVRDPGKGFDPRAAINTRGLGLVSMRERLNLIGGTLSIRSELTRGTQIIADVPLSWTALMPLERTESPLLTPDQEGCNPFRIVSADVSAASVETASMLKSLT